MAEASELMREILMFFNQHGIVWSNLENNYYLIMYDRKMKIVEIGLTMSNSNPLRLKISKQGITIYKVRDLKQAKKVVGMGEKPDSAIMLELLEKHGKVSGALAKEAGIKDPSVAVYNLTKRGYSIGRVDAYKGVIYTYDIPKQQII